MARRLDGTSLEPLLCRHAYPLASMRQIPPEKRCSSPPRSTRKLSLSLVAALTLMISTLSVGTSRADSTTSPPILVELFTSQGCSSCPAADRLLSQLAASNSNIVALAFHVDYRNYIGWTDPFSSGEWSDRQRRYAYGLQSDQIYTPQLVVNGRRHGVGSDRRELSAMLAEAAMDESAGRIEIEITDSSTTGISLELRTELEPSRETQNLVTWVALVEDGLETPVNRGDPASRILLHDRVVRRLERVDPVAGRAQTAVVDIGFDPEWRRDRLSIVAFLQDSETLHVRAAASVSLHS